MASISWLFAIGGDWSVAVDWGGTITPGATDDVTIDKTGSPYTVTIATTAEAAHSLTLDAAAATLSITKVLSVATTLDAAAGTLSLGSGGTLNGGTVNASGAAFVFVGGALNGVTWQGLLNVGGSGETATMTGANTLTGAGGLGTGSLEISGTNDVLTVTGTLNDTGGLSVDAGTFQVENGGDGTIGAAASNAGTIGLHNKTTLTVNGGFSNSAALNVDNVTAFQYAEGGSDLTITGTLDNTGNVQIGSTALNAATTITLGGLSNPGTASFALAGSAAHAATLAFSGGNGFNSNAGNFQLTYAAPLTLNGAFSNAGQFGLHNKTTLTVNGGFSNSAALDVDNATAFQYAEGGSDLTITGTLDNTGNVQIGNTALNAATTITLGGLSNPGTASFALAGSAGKAATLAFPGGIGFSSNAGNFQLTYAAPLTLNDAFSNTGQFGLHNNTTLTVNGGFSNSAALNVDNATAFQYSEGGSDLTITGTLDNTGSVQIGSTALNAATTITLGGLSNPGTASFALAGSAGHAATLAFPGGNGFSSNAGNFQLTYAAPLTLNGAFGNTGQFGLHNKTTLTVNGGFSNSAALNVDNATAFQYSEGGSDLTITGTLDNTGNVQIGSTALNAATTITLGGLSNPGTASFALAGSAGHAATLAFPGGNGFNSNAGNFQLTYAAPLTLNGAFSNTGQFGLHNKTTLTVNGGFSNSAALNVDNVTAFQYSEGGSDLTITGTLDNTGNVQIGSTALNAATTITLGGLSNPGTASFALAGSAGHAATLAFPGGNGFSSNAGNFQLTYAAPLTLNGAFGNTGQFGLHNKTTLTVNGGFSNSAALNVDNATAFQYSEGGSDLTITGTLDNTGNVQIGSTALNAATTITLGGLSNPGTASFALAGSAGHAATLAFPGGNGFNSNAGNFQLTYAAPLTLNGAFSNTGQFGLHNKTTLTVNGGFSNSAALNVDNVTAFQYAEGGSDLTIIGTLDNTGNVQIGSTALNAATTITLGGLSNPGTASFALAGSAGHAATLAFPGGIGFSSNAGNFQLTYAVPLTLNDAFSNTGQFGLHNKTTLTVNGGFSNSAALNVDNVTAFQYSEGGSDLTITGTLDNTGNVQIGSTALNAATTITLGGLSNSGAFSLGGGSSTSMAALIVSGPASNTGTMNIGSFTSVDITGSTPFMQTAGITTVRGALTAPGINIGGGTLAIDTTQFTNNNSLAAASGGLIDFSAGGLTNLSGGTLTGGTYEVDAGSTMKFAGGATIATDNADIVLKGTASVIESGATHLDAELTSIGAAGALHLMSGASFDTATAFFDSGLIGLNAGSFAAGGLVVASSGTVFGAGTLSTTAQTQNDGTIEASGGDLFIRHDIDGAGTLVIDNGATLELAGTSSQPIMFNAAGATGTALVGGTLLLDQGSDFTGTIPSGINSITNNSSLGNGVQLLGSGSVINGTSGNANAIINGGTYGVQFDDGAGTLTNAGTISGATGVVFGGSTSNGTVANSGTIRGTGGAAVSFGGTSDVTLTNAGAITGTTGIIFGDGTSSGTLTNSGAIEGTGGVAVSFGGTSDVLINQPGATFTGSVEINAGASLTLPVQIATPVDFNIIGSPSITATSTISFQTMTGAPVTVTLPDASSEGAGVVELADPSTSVDNNPDVSGLGDGAVDNGIEISGGGDDGASIEGGDGGSGAEPSALPGGASAAPASTIVVTNSGTVVARLPLLENLVGKTVHITHPSADETLLTVSCFAAGTRIMTTSGDVAVEELCAGTLLPTANGAEPQPVIWLGQRRIDARRHPLPSEVWPVRVRAGALSDGQPIRDVLLSPDHSVFLWNKLIPVRYLVNGATVLQEPVDTIKYFHVELPQHSVILADGLPVESYLDVGNRGDFDNGGNALTPHPDFSRQIWNEKACAEMALLGCRRSSRQRRQTETKERAGVRLSVPPQS